MWERFNREYDHTLSRIYATLGVVRSSERCFINLQFRLEFHVKQDIKQTPHEFQSLCGDGLRDVFDAMLREVYTSPASLYDILATADTSIYLEAVDCFSLLRNHYLNYLILKEKIALK